MIISLTWIASSLSSCFSRKHCQLALIFKDSPSALNFLSRSHPVSHFSFTVRLLKIVIYAHYLYFLTSHLLSDIHSLASAPTAPLYEFTKFSTYLPITKPKGHSESLSHFLTAALTLLTITLHSSLYCAIISWFSSSLSVSFMLLPGSVLYVWLSSRLLSSALLCLINATDFNYSFCFSDSKFLSSPDHSLSFTLICPTAYRTSRCG